MDEQIIERAVKAAAVGHYERDVRSNQPTQPPFADLFDFEQDAWRDEVRHIVTAALSEVEASLTAERDELSRWKEEALPALSDLQNLGRALDVPLGERITGKVAAKRAEELAARVARVEALADEYESNFAYHCVKASDCPICVTYQGVVIGMRRALRGES